MKIARGNQSHEFIIKGEKYFWEGEMEMFMPCTPAWYPEQHKEIK